jgi:glycine/serine hydroxymethyltransferase
MKEAEMEQLGSWIVEAVTHQADDNILARIKAEVVATAVRYSVP